MGWLSYFKIVNDYNPFIRKVNEILYRLVEPVIRPIRKVTRRILGDLGGIDLSPIILFALLYLLRNILYTYFYKF